MNFRENPDEAFQAFVTIVLFEYAMLFSVYYWRNDGYTDGAIVMGLCALLALRLLLFEPVELWTDREGNESA